MKRSPIRRTGFAKKLPIEQLPKKLLVRLVEQHLIDPAEYGLSLPKRKPMFRVIRDGRLYLGPDKYGRLWPWPHVPHLSEADYDGTLVEWAIKIGGALKVWHCRSPQASLAGWPDLVFLFRGYGLFTEDKVRDEDGELNIPSTAQKAYLSALSLAGFDARQFTHPDDTFEAWEVLTRRPVEECPYWAETVAA